MPIFDTPTFDTKVHQYATEAADLVIRKQSDYGPDNILKCPVGAELGIVVRLYDKLSRLANLLQSGKTPNNESLTDTADDIIGYGLLLKMVISGDFTLPLEPLPDPDSARTVSPEEYHKQIAERERRRDRNALEWEERDRNRGIF